MKYDFTQELVNSEGTVVKVSDTNATPWTAWHALKSCILADTQANADSKMARYELFLKLKSATDATDFTAEEVSLLKTAALTLPTIFAGQLAHLLDQK